MSPDDDNDDDIFPEPYDDGGVPTLLITLTPPSPLPFFGRLLQAIGEIAPGSVVKSSDKGYEVWSR